MATRIVDRMDHLGGSVEDIPVLVNAVKSLIGYAYYLQQKIHSMEMRLQSFGQPNDGGTECWISVDLAQEFGVDPPSELLDYVEARRLRLAIPASLRESQEELVASG